MKKNILLLLIITVLMLTTSCSENKVDPQQNSTLHIGVMPAVDSAPIFLAEKRGYFKENNLDIKIELFTNAQNRQSALQSNQIDGAMTDLIALATNVNSDFPVKATMSTDGMFIILANQKADTKKDVSVGLMEISVSNFLVDHWLSNDYNVNKIYINSIPGRLEALASNQIDMGLFPEPVASIGENKGLKKLTFDKIDGYSPDVMVFTDMARKNKKNAIEAFHKGYNMAIKALQKDESLAKKILIQKIPNLPEDIESIISLPTYHKARLPDEDYINSIISWTNLILEEPLTIDSTDLIDSQFID